MSRNQVPARHARPAPPAPLTNQGPSHGRERPRVAAAPRALSADRP